MFFCCDINQTIPVLCETRTNFNQKILGEHRLLFLTFSKKEATLTYSSSTRRTGFYFFKWAVDPSLRTRVLLASLTRNITQNHCLGNTPFYCIRSYLHFYLFAFFTLLLCSRYKKKKKNSHPFPYIFHSGGNFFLSFKSID